MGYEILQWHCYELWNYDFELWAHPVLWPKQHPKQSVLEPWVTMDRNPNGSGPRYIEMKTERVSLTTNNSDPSWAAIEEWLCTNTVCIAVTCQLSKSK